MTLHHASLQEALAGSGFTCVLETFDQLPSTSEYLAEQADIEDVAAHVVACDWQTQGNGRRGKSWDTLPGNITFSVKTIAPLPPARLMGLSLVTGISVAQALQSVCDLSVELKWPNDVIIKDRKLCGLLTELQNQSSGNATSVIAGIGINVLEDERIKGLGVGGISLNEVCNTPIDRETLIATVVSRLLANYRVFYQYGWNRFSADWSQRDYLAGKSVTLLRNQQEQTVDVIGLDSSGALLVQSDGVSEAIYSGDVSVRVTA